MSSGRKLQTFVFIFLLFCSTACSCARQDPAVNVEPRSETDITPNADAIDYYSIYDRDYDGSGFFYPEMSGQPAMYWSIPDLIDRSDRNDKNLSSPTEGLQYHLLAQSLAGIVNRACKEGKTRVAVWLELRGSAYDKAKSFLGKSAGSVSAVDLCTKYFPNVNGVKVSVKDLISGYVLTDVRNNPESNQAATIAASVYNSIIVDVRDEKIFKDAGFSMKYDASDKSTADAWREFKGKCNNKALVIMPVDTGELREYAICNGLFCFNLNRRYNTASGGQNISVFNEILEWMAPNSPVLGWEQGVAEDVFVDRISKHGKIMLASDWSYNHSLTSLNARTRKPEAVAKVLNPRDIDYSVKKRFVSFFLSDGDNYQWLMGDGFVGGYYNLPASNKRVNMSFGICSSALGELAPARLEDLYSYQGQTNTLIETFGGGYFYADTYSTLSANRQKDLEIIAQRTAEKMRRNRIKILQLIAKDWRSNEAKQAYQAFIDANEDLEGIIVISYDPYTAGKGEILWCTNTKDYDIPVISARYALWANNTNPSNGTGTPREVAKYIDSQPQEHSCSAVVVHAWSSFNGKISSNAAAECMNYTSTDTEAVSIQELVWRIRMEKRPHQTVSYLRTIK